MSWGKNTSSVLLVFRVTQTPSYPTDFSSHHKKGAALQEFITQTMLKSQSYGLASSWHSLLDSNHCTLFLFLFSLSLLSQIIPRGRSEHGIHWSGVKPSFSAQVSEQQLRWARAHNPSYPWLFVLPKPKDSAQVNAALASTRVSKPGLSQLQGVFSVILGHASWKNQDLEMSLCPHSPTIPRPCSVPPGVRSGDWIERVVL